MPSIEIRFFDGEVRVNGVPVALPDKEKELLFTVAAAGTMNGEQLMDMLWPDADGDAAHNAFRVCLHRLRRHVNCGDVIRRTGKAYAIDRGIRIDLHAVSDPDELVARIRAGYGARASLGAWFEPFERLLWNYLQRCRKCRASDLVTER